MDRVLLLPAKLPEQRGGPSTVATSKATRTKRWTEYCCYQQSYQNKEVDRVLLLPVKLPEQRGGPSTVATSKATRTKRWTEYCCYQQSYQNKEVDRVLLLPLKLPEQRGPKCNDGQRILKQGRLQNVKRRSGDSH